MTDLHHAAQLDDPAASAALAAAFHADPAALNRPDNRGRTPVWMAVWKSRPAALRQLLAWGADPRLADEEGLAPIHLAALADPTHAPELLALLLDAGADLERPARGALTALHFAARDGLLPAARLLLDRHANINARTLARETPLHWALYEGQEEMALFLLQNGAALDAQDAHGDTALHEAARFEYEAVARALCQKGAPLDLPNDAGQTPRELLAETGWPWLPPPLGQS
ncbi:MAG: ankyrin repeat domain-containing protein [Planctomycetota bacterium]